MGRRQFTGWEDESIIYLGPGLMESFSRARLKLFIVLGHEGEKEMKYYNDFRKNFLLAEKQGLVKFEHNEYY